MNTATANRGGRPRKSPLERRSVPFTPRFTEIEAAVIRHNAANIGISPTEYVYRSTIKEKLNVPPRRTADPHLITRLDRLACEVRDMGSVVNQVATYLHCDREIPHDMQRIATDIQRLKKSIAETIGMVVGE